MNADEEMNGFISACRCSSVARIWFFDSFYATMPAWRRLPIGARVANPPHRSAGVFAAATGKLVGWAD
jgi:hypothetical protein